MSNAFEFDELVDNLIESHKGKVRITWGYGTPLKLFTKWVSKEEVDNWLGWRGPRNECPYPDPFTNNQ